MSTSREMLVNPVEKTLYIPEDVEQSYHARAAFAGADHSYRADKEGYFKLLEDSVFTFQSFTGAEVQASILPGKSSSLLVMWAPFSDCAPKSTAEEMKNYVQPVNQTATPISVAAPNTWNQITKSATTWELLRAMGHDMPVLTIFSPLPSYPVKTFAGSEFKQVKQGDYRPAGWLVQEAVKKAQEKLHGADSETQLSPEHFHGASLGASYAIGAATNYAERSASDVWSVTAQELIIGPKFTLIDLPVRFAQTIGEKSLIDVPENVTVQAEPALRQDIDKKGAEKAMYGRMLLGMSKISQLKGLTRPHRNKTPKNIETLLENNVSVVIPLAENSGATHQTEQFLPGDREKVVRVRATEGQRIGHDVDELVGVTALLAAMNVRDNSYLDR